MSVVQYGNETLKYCTLRAWDMRHVYTEDGVDLQYIEHRVSVDAVLSVDLESGVSMPDLVYRVRQNLACPRQPLAIWLGNDASENLTPARTDLWGEDGPDGHGVDDGGIDADDPDFGTGAEAAINALGDGESILNNKVLDVPAPDINAGPRVEGVTIHGVKGSRLAFLSATFVAHVHPCPVAPPILSNRWELRTAIDRQQLTTLTWHGVARVNPYVHPSADAIRESCIPPLPPMFVPESSDWNLSSDGLTMRYTVVYKEAPRLPPSPFVEMEGDYDESTTLGAVTDGNLRLTGRAPRTVSKQDMLQRMAQIVMSYFRFNRNGVGGDTLKFASIGESLFDNRVTITVQAQKVGAQKVGAAPVALDAAVFGQPNVGDRTEMPDMTSRGSAMHKAVAAAWKACCASAPGPAVEQKDGSVIPVADLQRLGFAVTDLPMDNDDELSGEQRQAPYYSYGQMIEYETCSGVVTMPYAEKVAGGSAGGKDKTAAHIRLHQPYTKKRVRYSGDRHGRWPKVPKPMTKDKGGVVQKSSIEAEAPKAGADLSTYKYGLSGQHEVSLDYHLDPTQKPVVGGVSPMYQMPVDDSEIMPGCFVDDLAEGGGEEPET